MNSQAVTKHSVAARHTQSGVTLIELLVAMVIGLFLALGSITVFTQSRASYRLSDGQARLQENLRFAMDNIEPDIRLARFWGRNNEPGLVQDPAGVAVACGGADATALATTFNLPVASVDDSVGYAAGIPCAAASGARADSDALIVRHVSAQATPLQAGRLQVRSDLGTATLFNDGANPAGFGANAQTHDLVVNVYYVDNGSNLDPNLPSLRRWTLNAAGNLVDEEMIAGVENLQVQLGIDETGNGTVTRYVDGNNAAAAANPVMAVRLWILMRSEQPETGFVDNAVYTPPDADLGVINPGAAGYLVNARREQITKTIQLRNNR
ncbi:MAG: PilW family protein [Gammaproteobacteria bacterium]